MFHKKKKQIILEDKECSSKKFQLDPEAIERIENEYDDPDPYDDDLYEQEVPARPKKKWLRKIIVRVLILCIILMFINVGIMFATGNIWFNEPRKKDYPIRGPVITEKMGDINWEKFSHQNIQMAYIRATKSSTYEDKNFSDNWEGAEENDFPVGAFHVFDPNIDGKEQAEHFISVVGTLKGKLLPAVEVKMTGFNLFFSPDYKKVTKRLMDFVETIKGHYKVYPIIYCDKKTYKNIVCYPDSLSDDKSENFKGCPVWYESIYSKPKDDIEWNFWSYTNRVKFNYYETDCYLTMVLFNGKENDFRKYYLN